MFEPFSAYLLIPLLLVSCSERSKPPVEETTDTGELPDPELLPDTVEPAPYPRPCDVIFDQDRVPVLDVEVSEKDWALIEHDYAHGYEMQLAGLDPKQYHPAVFRFEGEIVDDASIRLKGNPCCSWYGPKMQFDIAFNKQNEEGRFHGLRHIDFDAPPYDVSMLHNRLANAYFADLGIPSLCANNARLNINGEFYGLYTLMEHMDQEWLNRNFEEPDGTLYKYGWTPETNEDNANEALIERFWSTTDFRELVQFVDVKQSIQEWAGEAMLPDGDGFWAGSGNFFLYDHPSRGLMFIPWDLDYSLEVTPYDADPFTWVVDWGQHPALIQAAIAEPRWQREYVAALVRAREAYDADLTTERVKNWSNQIRSSVVEDQRLLFSYPEWKQQVQMLVDFVPARAAFMDDWLDKQQEQ